MEKLRLLLFKLLIDNRRRLRFYFNYETSLMLNLRDDESESETLLRRPKGHALLLLLEKVSFLNTEGFIISRQLTDFSIKKETAVEKQSHFTLLLWDYVTVQNK